MIKIENLANHKNCFIGKVNTNFNKSIENRYLVSDIANIAKGGFESKNQKKRYEHLLTESVNEPSTPLEFVPVVISNKFLCANRIALTDDVCNYFLNYTFKVSKENYEVAYFTNFRNVAKLGIKEIPFNTDAEVANFRIITGRLPYFVLMHLRTHRKLSFIFETGRKDYAPEYYETNDKRYKDKKDFCEIRKFAISGWLHDKNGFENLLNVRSSVHTQEDTKIFCEMIKEIIY